MFGQDETHTGFVSRSGVRVMVRLARLCLAAAVSAAVLTPAAPADASSFWSRGFVEERPVLYRPVVTPQTYYFVPAAPAASTEVIPAPVIRHVHPHRHRQHRSHR
jgi:hypothetical protein